MHSDDGEKRGLVRRTGRGTSAADSALPSLVFPAVPAWRADRAPKTQVRLLVASDPRARRSRAPCKLARSIWLALLAGCYLSPDTHPVSLRKVIEAGASELDAGEAADAQAEIRGDLDGAAHMDAGCTSHAACPIEAPACAEGDCVACRAHEDCARFASAPACGSIGACVPCTVDLPSLCADPTPACDPNTNRCEQCVADSHCKNPASSACQQSTHVCVPCVANANCAHLERQPVCLTGQCVECTKDQLEACRAPAADAQTVQYVCDPARHVCDRSRLARSKGACEPCISDFECVEGYFCVDLPAGGGQRVCQQQYLDSAPCARPYLSRVDAFSAEGQLVSVCTFRVANTTCQAHRQYSNTSCGSDAGDNARCGVQGVDDGYCVQDSTSEYRCTVACTNADVRDCPLDAPACAEQAHAGGMLRNLCTL